MFYRNYTSKLIKIKEFFKALIKSVKMYHTTLSMQNLLNQPLDPQICKRLLNQIKSPLMQQSFQLTNDSSPQNSFYKAPKRPNIPPPSFNQQASRRPAIKNAYQTAGFGERNNRNYQNRDFRSYSQDNNFLGQIHQQISGRIEAQSIVSPLDPNITLKDKEQENDFEAIKHFCGNLFNKDHQKQYQLEFDDTQYPSNQQKKISRRKIFTQNKQKPNLKTIPGSRRVCSILLEPQKTDSHIQLQQTYLLGKQSQPLNLGECIEKLKRNNNKQVANFVLLVVSIMEQVEKMSQNRKYLTNKMEIVYQLLSYQDAQFNGFTNEGQFSQRFLSRMNAVSLPDLLKKLFQVDYIRTNKKSFKQFNNQRNQVEIKLKILCQSLNRIEEILKKYAENENIVGDLRRVYDILSRKFTSQNTLNTSEVFNRLFSDIRQRQFQDKICYLSYIWPQMNNKILSQGQFINDLLRGHIHYRNDLQKNRQDDHLEKELSKLGFTKN